MVEIYDSLGYNTLEYETRPMVRRTGFREYDARWRVPDELNPLGVQYLGAAIATQMTREGSRPPSIIVGHDYRSYSASVKAALTVGLLSAGASVYDIGLATSPMAYFAQFHLNVPGVVMVTASHNENGWTGLKMGSSPPVTYGPQQIAELRELAYSGEFLSAPGKYTRVPTLLDAYIDDLTNGRQMKQKLRVVVATGNGTCGMVVPKVIERLGCEVIPVHTELDWNFPNGNPNPEDLAFLVSIKAAVKEHRADLGFGFDGDGDRLGVVDDEGEELFSDKVGVLLARHFSSLIPNSHFVVDVKSTSLFSSDPILRANSATTEYWMTGHSYIKSRINETQALAGFEKSGHFFFRPPFGRGYDDALLSAIHVLTMVTDKGVALSELREGLPHTFQSPTMAPYCEDDQKYAVVAKLTELYEQDFENGVLIAGHRIRSLNTVNGVRVEYDDGSWGLVRASSNKPSLVVVIESVTTKARVYEIFGDIDARLKRQGGVGDYDQTLPPPEAE
jgi:phosphomannomutase/phosphoglucomutase